MKIKLIQKTNYMFKGCISLIQIPKLPATKLISSCYNSMFYGCSQIKISTTQTSEYNNIYRIPMSGSGNNVSYCLDSMFTNTGGTFKGTPTINTTYYTSNEVI